MRFYYKAVKASLAIYALMALLYSPRSVAQALTDTTPSAPQAHEKEASPDQGWHIGVTPYIWFSGVHGATGVLGHEASVHASFGDIFNYLNIGLMSVVETRYNRVLMPVDFMWMKLSDEKGLPITDNVRSIKAKMTETMLTPKIGYRIADGKKVKVDALFGLRYWHLTTDFTLEPTQPLGGFSQTANWVDAVAGGRIELALSPKAFAIVGGDAGGGSARSDFQVAGFIGYRISRKWVLLSGYRYLSVNYRPLGKAKFVYDVNMPGLVLGATYNIK
jgi:hypothetical protein